MLPTIQTILYATDLGRHASLAFRHALSIARCHGAKIHILHVVEPLTPGARHLVELYGSGTVTPEQEREHEDQLRQAMGEKLKHFCEGETCRLDGGDEAVADYRVLVGKPSEVLLAEQKRLGADLIVLGSHGHGTVGEVLLGSTAHRVAQRSPVPVLLVPVPQEDTQDGL